MFDYLAVTSPSLVCIEPSLLQAFPYILLRNPVPIIPFDNVNAQPFLSRGDRNLFQRYFPTSSDRFATQQTMSHHSRISQSLNILCKNISQLADCHILIPFQSLFNHSRNLQLTSIVTFLETIRA